MRFLRLDQKNNVASALLSLGGFRFGGSSHYVTRIVKQLRRDTYTRSLLPTNSSR